MVQTGATPPGHFDTSSLVPESPSRHCRVSPPSRRSPAFACRPRLTTSLSAFPALKDGAFEAAIDTLSPVRGLAARSRPPVLRRERAEPRDPHLLFLCQALGDRVEHGVDRSFGHRLAQTRPAGHAGDNVRLLHPFAFRSRGRRCSLQSRTRSINPEPSPPNRHYPVGMRLRLPHTARAASLARS